MGDHVLTSTDPSSLAAPKAQREEEEVQQRTGLGGLFARGFLLGKTAIATKNVRKDTPVDPVALPVSGEKEEQLPPPPQEEEEEEEEEEKGRHLWLKSSSSISEDSAEDGGCATSDATSSNGHPALSGGSSRRSDSVDGMGSGSGSGEGEGDGEGGEDEGQGANLAGWTSNNGNNNNNNSGNNKKRSKKGKASKKKNKKGKQRGDHHAGTSNHGHAAGPKAPEEWACGACTYLNDAGALTCIMCFSEPPKEHVRNGTHAEATVPTNSCGGRQRTTTQRRARRIQKSVSFGEVVLTEFQRAVGGCSVPGEGSWGLSMGEAVRFAVVHIDQYEAVREERLEERLQALPKKLRRLCTGETRQFDHCNGVRNPLFTRLDEKERRALLLDFACSWKGTTPQDTRGAGRGNNSRGSSSKIKISHEAFVQRSQDEGVQLEALRSSRRDTGRCRCQVVCPDKMSAVRLREELRRRRVGGAGTKKELAARLHDILSQEGGRTDKLCSGEDCPCARDGVECHSEACSCCRGHHKHNHKEDSQACVNPDGTYIYKSARVDAYRAVHISAHPAPHVEQRHARLRSYSCGSASP